MIRVKSFPSSVLSLEFRLMLLTYATRHQTRQQHMDTLREIYGYKGSFAGGAESYAKALASDILR
jgi:hypothetical protein